MVFGKNKKKEAEFYRQQMEKSNKPSEKQINTSNKITEMINDPKILNLIRSEIKRALPSENKNLSEKDFDDILNLVNIVEDNLAELKSHIRKLKE